MKLRLIILLFISCTIYCFAVDYHLSNAGNDANNGTSSATAWQNLSRLNTALANGTIQTNDRILFRRGDTFRGSITFQNNSGITFDSYGTGDIAIIKGSQIVTSWTVHSGSIWKATVSSLVYFLYANATPQILARHPNSGTFNASAATVTSATSTAIGTSGQNFVGANLCYREYDWELSRRVVTSQNGNVVGWATNIPTGNTNANFYFDNKLSLIDANNEWFHDTATNTLYLQSSVDPNTLTIEANISLRGIDGNNNKSNNIIRNLQFEHYADAAIYLPGTTNSNLITANVFKNNYTAMFIGGNNNATLAQATLINNNTFDGNFGEAIFMANTANSNMSFNTISNTALVFGKHRPNFVGEFHTTGIRVINAKAGTLIANNFITNSGNIGIRFNGPGVIVENNIVENSLLNMSDGGGIYTVGAESTNGIIRNNFVKNVVGDHNGVPGGIALGIYIDNKVSNFLITGNTVEDIPTGAGILINAEAFNHTITNNVVYKCLQSVNFSDWLQSVAVYGNSLSGNTFYANIGGSTSTPVLIASSFNRYNALISSNNNYLINPFNANKVVSYIWSTIAEFSLTQWRTATGFDMASVGSHYTWTPPTDNSFIVKNPTANPVILNYSNTVDLNNVPVSSVSIPAYSSKVLISVAQLPSGGPTAVSPQNFCSGATIADIAATGTNLKWYAAANGGVELPLATTLVNSTTYHVSQTVAGFSESVRTPVIANLGATTSWVFPSQVWSNGAPGAGVGAVFNNVPYGGAALSACSLQISGTANVNIASWAAFNIDGAVTVAPTSLLTIRNNAILLQNKNVANTGNVTVQRETSPLMRLDYSMWSSPVANQNLLAFSPATLTNRFYTYNSNTNVFETIVPSANNFVPGRGYLIRLPNNHPTTPTQWTGNFTGVPNNGPVNVTLNEFGIGKRFNMVGNPYPSPINMSSFVAANTTAITGTLWFWRKTNSTTNTNRWNTWNNGVFVPAPSEANITNPNGIIRTAQGFIVEAVSAPTQLVFNNSMRAANYGNQFFRNSNLTTDNVVQKSTLWLQANSSSGEFCQLAVSYTDGGTNAVDKFDAKNLSDSPITFTSKVDGTADLFTIQGRPAPFVNTDVVPLHFKSTIADTFTIAITDKEGAFADGTQPVYIHDKLTNTFHDIINNPFTFTSSAATFADRFDLKFNQTILGTPNFNENNSLNVYVKDNNININQSNLSQIKEVRLYDMKGALLFEKKGVYLDKYSFEFTGAEQVLILKVVLADDQIINKKIIN